EDFDRVGGAVGEFVDARPVDVGEGVVGSVVVGVELLPSGTAVAGSLFRGLGAVRAAEQATGRDSGQHERPVVGATAELGGLCGQAAGGEVVFEHFLDRR